MPYISQVSRKKLEDSGTPTNAGEMNYVLTKIILNSKSSPISLVKIFVTIFKQYIENTEQRYQKYNDIMGAVTGCILELRRRFPGKYLQEMLVLWLTLTTYYREVIASYEDKAIERNGDII